MASCTMVAAGTIGYFCETVDHVLIAKSFDAVIYFDTSIFLDKVVNASSNGTNASNASYAPEPEPEPKDP